MQEARSTRPDGRAATVLAWPPMSLVGFPAVATSIAASEKKAAKCLCRMVAH